MNRYSATRAFAATAVLASLNFGAATPAWANPITLAPNTANMFRDTRGINDVGIGAGDLLQFGANILGGSAGTTLRGIYPALPAATSFATRTARCSPLTVNPNFCANATNFDSSRIASPWTLHFGNGTDMLDETGPSLTINSSAILKPVPFPVSVTFSKGAKPSTPTISWVIPGGFAPDAFRVNIFDRSLPDLPNGQKDIVHSVAIGADSATYTIPEVLSAGGSLDPTHNYTINFQLIETRDHVAFSNNNAQILRRSSSFFDFTPVTASGPPHVYLPTVGPDPDPTDHFGPAFNFKVTEVGPTSVTFIDPFVATGYDYAIGAGDPNFASVILPDVGDGIYDLIFGTVHSTLLAGQQFFFPAGGVSAFSVRDIEVGAALDPANTNAFITGLTFVSAGDFTGTMTPIVQFVPEGKVPAPGTITLLAFALAALGSSRRTRSAQG